VLTVHCHFVVPRPVNDYDSASKHRYSTSSDLTNETPVKVIHYNRRPRNTGNFSIEYVFSNVRSRLDGWDVASRSAPYVSNGIFRRLLICLDAWWNQEQITHVTGDIHFAVLLLNRQTTVLTIHDCIGADRNGLKGWLYRLFWFRLPAQRCKVVTTVSEASKQEIIRVSGCPEHKVFVIPNAISELFCHKNGPPRKLRSRPRLLQIGTAPNKNIERLAIALSGISCELVIIGMLSQSQRRCLSGSEVVFTEKCNLSTAELVEEYHNSDLLIFASTLEGFGMPIIEAHAAGVPVVTSNCSAMPHTAGNAAILVDPFDAASIRDGVLKVLNDESLRVRLIDAGFANAKRFHPDRIAEQYAQVYRDVLEQNSTLESH
jgi:glycosyltransferase involved in cell wall biosynthesis